MPTTVVCVRGRQPKDFAADPLFLYVGRRWNVWPPMIFGNPFRPGMRWDEAIRTLISAGVRRFGDVSCEMTVEDCLACYRAWATHFGPVRCRLPLLRGKRLGCWCGEWDGVSAGAPDCHAVVLARLADGPLGDPRGD